MFPPPNRHILSHKIHHIKLVSIALINQVYLDEDDCGQSLGVNLDWTRKAGCENKQTLPELKSRQTIQRCKHLSHTNISVQSKILLRQHHPTSSLSPLPPFPHFISRKCLCGHAIYKPHKSTKLLHSAKGFPSQISACQHHYCFSINSYYD